VRPSWLPAYFSPAVARDLGRYLDEARGDGPPLNKGNPMASEWVEMMPGLFVHPEYGGIARKRGQRWYSYSAYGNLETGPWRNRQIAEGVLTPAISRAHPPMTDPSPAERLAEIERARTRKDEA
jgi:hypothetical protein